ncbi:alpha-amylase family protein [Tessaracoccus caeni]|uniref:sucrose phosphorylase n=1 Tax=Tessaracoccus caeni TaxID=3031239 RepID=UPI0023DB6102|nr:sucrose phosphorylase [Tessaracoccus caeni]MDF1489021.1 sucrose phosphorylase [Tessaracoccus caeni]
MESTFRSMDLDALVAGDMPGDKIQISESHLDKADIIWPELQRRLEPLLADGGRAVISVHGGSGVGKSEIGSLLAHALKAAGIGAYVMSGDNYPRRVPSANDAERLRTFRVSGVQGLVAEGLYDDAVREQLAQLQAADQDADPAQRAEHPWLATYQKAGRRGLTGYLGTSNEIDFDEVNAILAAFHDGADALTLKRMGRTPDQLWYDAVDVSDVPVLVVEWTHGNNDNLRGVDIPILLNSTPAETLAHRRARNRDGGTDSPFTTMVLELEQELLHSQAHRAAIIVAKNGELLDYDAYLRTMGRHLPGSGPMLNVYPDSIGERLSGTVDLLTDPAVAGAFESAYLLPSVFNTDLDRGFSVISYDLSERLTSPEDLPALVDAGVDLKFDFILNHASVLSPQFQDILRNGERSRYADFFIDWNAFWAGHGELTEGGWIQPDPELIKDMFFRKAGLPILMVRMPDGTEKPYWNTFYQEVRYTTPDPQDLMEATGLQYGSAEELVGRIAATLADGGRPADVDFAGYEAARDAVVELLESKRRYLGQMDLNIQSPLVWEFYAETLDRLAGYGARIVRLDAFAYAPKAPGERNFLNDPGTWDLLAEVKQLADTRGVQLLPEIHSRYAEGIHQTIADKGFLTYDFFLPGLVLDAFERQDTTVLRRWIGEVIERKINTVTMLGCHDGIPVLDLQGLLDDDRIQELIDVIVSRGGYVKDLHGAKNVYYQVNATYFSALGEDEAKMLLARAIQLFTPGKPQIWYLDLFAGRNDHAAVERAGAGGHKEINRTNLSPETVAEGLQRPIVAQQLELLRFRNHCPAFGFDATCTIGETPAHQLEMTWTKDGHTAVLTADLATSTFQIRATGPDGEYAL